MALTMTEEQEREVRADAVKFYDADHVHHDSFVRAPRQRELLLRELDATRAELARLRAEMPSEGERAALGRLRELARDRLAGPFMCMLAREQMDAHCNDLWGETMRALLVLLAPEGEVSRG